MPAISDVIHDMGVDGTTTGGAVLNVRAYGAVGDGIADDTAAVTLAVNTANALHMGSDSDTASNGRGSVVFFPQGLYKLTQTIHLASGVSVRGAGMHTTQLQFAMAATADGLVWDTNPSAAADFLVGGCLEDISVKAVSRTNGTTAQDLVVVQHATAFAMNRVRIYAATRYNLHLVDCIDVSAFHLHCIGAGTSNLYLTSAAQGTVTTHRFVASYFQGSDKGPCVDVLGMGLTFDGCVFESALRPAANPLPDQGTGIRIRWGTAVLVNPYFENNSGFDLLSGTDATTNPAERAQQTAVTVINPTVVMTEPKYGGGFRFVRGSATVLGGDLRTVNRPLVFSSQVTYVHVAVNTSMVAPPELEGGNVADLPGLVVYRSPATNLLVTTGRAAYQIGGGTPISKHISELHPWTPNGGLALADRASTKKEFNVAGVDFGDTVVVGLKHGDYGLGGGVMLYGSVSAPSKVAVTLLNVYNAAITLGASTVRIDVWKHWPTAVQPAS